MSTTTDVILAAGPTIVAVVAIGAAVWQQQRGFGHERRMRDLGDVRAVLDEAAVALNAAEYAYHNWEETNLEDIRGEFGPPELADARETIDRARERLSIRLGPLDETVTDLDAAKKALGALEGAWVHFEYEQYQRAGKEVDWDQLGQTQVAVTAGLRQLRTARADFLTSAAAVAGAELP